MNRVHLLLGTLVLAAVAAGAMAWMLRRPEPEWTTRSAAAREAYRAALDAEMKYYLADAVRQLEKAVALDPDFAMAKLELAFLGRRGEEQERLLGELRAADLSHLQERERFLIGYWLARSAGRRQEATELLDAFLERHPTDPFALSARCSAAWELERWDEAEACYRRLIDLHPNWVQAQNRLGYIAMARGRFSEAEEHFRTYRYIAPDQANPYDSLGELLTVLGRYDEAEEAFRSALAVKPDFCDAYPHLATLYLAAGDGERLRRVVDEAAAVAACEPRLALHDLRCEAELWALYLEGRRDEAWRLSQEECREGPETVTVLAHRLAVLEGRLPEALAIEAEVRRAAEEAKGRGRSDLEAVLSHLEGVRRLAAGEGAAAAELLRQADEQLAYWGGTQAQLKLFNRLDLARSLEASGRPSEAQAVLHSIEAVNPRYVAGFERYAVTPGSAAAAGTLP